MHRELAVESLVQQSLLHLVQRGQFALVSGHEAIGFETLALAAVEPAISADDESYNRLQGTQRQRWLDLLYAISTERSILGASRHLLYVGQKR